MLLELSFENAKALIELETSFDVTPERALKLLRERADDFQFLVEKRERDSLRVVLDDALTNGLSAENTAAAIQDAFAEGFHRLNDAGEAVLIAPTNAWAETVARTELATAATAGALELYTEAGVEKLRFQASDPCDECAEYDDNVYPLDDLPVEIPVHCNCRCAWTPADDDLGSHRGTDEERAAARRGNADDSED